MIRIQMRIAQRVHEIAGLQTAHLRHHMGQQCVAGDIERHAQEDVAAALVPVSYTHLDVYKRQALNGVADSAQIEAAGLRPDARAEQVEVAGFVRLANLLATG